MSPSSNAVTETGRPVGPTWRSTIWIPLCLVAALLWWAWPTLSGADAKPPVVVVLQPSDAAFARTVEITIREQGRRARVVVAEAGWCEATAVGTALQASRRVVVADPEPGCDPWSSVGSDDHWVWIAPSGLRDQPSLPPGVTVVDMTWSLGDGGTLRRPCEWWDECDGDGQVAVRSEPGVLTVAGATRIARTVAVLR